MNTIMRPQNADHCAKWQLQAVRKKAHLSTEQLYAHCTNVSVFICMAHCTNTHFVN